jgi:hypothetical protein
VARLAVMQSLTFRFVLLFGTNEVTFLSDISLLEAFKLVEEKDSRSIHTRVSTIC